MRWSTLPVWISHPLFTGLHAVCSLGWGPDPGIEYPVTSRDLGIFVNQATEPVPAQDPSIQAYNVRTFTPSGLSLAQCPVLTMNVIMLDVLTQDHRRCRSPVISIRSWHSRRRRWKSTALRSRSPSAWKKSAARIVVARASRNARQVCQDRLDCRRSSGEFRPTCATAGAQARSPITRIPARSSCCMGWPGWACEIGGRYALAASWSC